MALRLNLENRRAVTLDISENGKPLTVGAAREIILSGGVINSPHLLMLSGIGPADHLQTHGIPVLQDLPGVGQNLQDHMSAWVNYERLSDSPFIQQMRFDRLAVNMVRATCSEPDRQPTFLKETWDLSALGAPVKCPISNFFLPQVPC